MESTRAEKASQQKSESQEENKGMSMAPPQFKLAASDDAPVQRKEDKGFWGNLWDGLGDAFNARDNEEELDLYEEYEEARDDMYEFMDEEHTLENHVPSTGLGMFDVAYGGYSGQLDITLKCSFDFINGSLTDYPYATEADVTWTDADKEAWKNDWMTRVHSTWSAKHTFHCQKDWWERRKATTNVSVTETSDSPHFKLEIKKIPKNRPNGSVEFDQSWVRRPATHLFGGFTPGKGKFDSNDLVPTPKGASEDQYAAVHEAGHMLGLDDEYVQDSPYTPDHNDLVNEYLGHDVAVAGDSRIMSGGNTVMPEHGVTFLEALIEATDMEEWGYVAKEPKPIPTNPNLGPGDYIQPSPDGPFYA